jgi:hypothetical protein
LDVEVETYGAPLFRGSRTPPFYHCQGPHGTAWFDRLAAQVYSSVVGRHMNVHMTYIVTSRTITNLPLLSYVSENKYEFSQKGGLILRLEAVLRKVYRSENEYKSVIHIV